MQNCVQLYWIFVRLLPQFRATFEFFWAQRWPSGTVLDFAIARSWVRIPPTAAVYQRQLSVPSLWGRLMSTSGSWGVNGHTTRCTSPVSMVLQLRLVSGWGLQETELSAALWALEARERTLLLLFTTTFLWTTCVPYNALAHKVLLRHVLLLLTQAMTVYNLALHIAGSKGRLWSRRHNSGSVVHICKHRSGRQPCTVEITLDRPSMLCDLKHLCDRVGSARIHNT